MGAGEIEPGKIHHFRMVIETSMVAEIALIPLIPEMAPVPSGERVKFTAFPVPK